MADIDKDFVEFVVKELVDNPDQVVIERSVDERGVLLELTVAPEDMGKVIGKAGSTAKAIRTLLRVLGAKSDARFNLKIVEPEGSTHESSNNDERESHKPTETADTTESSEQASEQVDEPIDRADDIKAKAREGLEDLDLDV